MEGLRSTDLQFQNSFGDVKYSIKNIITIIVIIMYVASWVLEISGEHFIKYMAG